MTKATIDPVWVRNEIDSPCVNICVVHPTAGICAGCYRTLQEIADWSTMTPDNRAALMAQLPDRSGQLKKRRGGREARLNDR